MADRRRVTIWIKDQTGWQAVGSGVLGSGIIPENVQLVADRYGSKTATFDLRRDPIFMWPDLQAFNPIKVEIDGAVVWSGRISETPTRLDPDDRVISVQAEGWQAHMDDDPYWKKYVHTKLADFKDLRSIVTANLGGTAAAAAGQVTTDSAITLMIPQGSTVGIGTHVGVVLDLGPGNTMKRVVVTWSAWGGNASLYFYGRGSDYPDNAAGWTPGNYEDLFAIANTPTGPTTSAATFTTARRYLQLFHYSSGNFGALGGDIWIRISSVKVFADAAYESGNASILKASDVLKDGLPHAPKLSQDTSGISLTSFSIPDLAPDQYQTFREYADAVNVFHNYVLMVDADARVIFKAQPSVPRLEIGAWSGYSFEDASANSGADLYNKIIVQGTGPDGSPLTATSSTTDSLVTRQGFTRTKILSVDAALTSTSAQQIGDTYLAGHQDIVFKGTITVTGAGAVRDSSGSPLAPERVLLLTNELIRLLDQINPDTGAIGREGRIAEVTYDVDEDQLTIALDNTRANFEALLARYAVVVGSSVQGL